MGKTGFLSLWTRVSHLELELIQACYCQKEISEKLNLKTRKSIGVYSVSIPHPFQHLRSKHLRTKDIEKAEKQESSIDA